MSDNDPDAVGKGRPPRWTQWKKGETGNQNGRPRGRKKHAPHEDVLGPLIDFNENGVSKRKRTDEALILSLYARAFKGNDAIARLLNELAEKRRSLLPRSPTKRPVFAFGVYDEPGQVDGSLQSLGITKVTDPYRPTARTFLEPWAVQEALDRLGKRRFNLEEQAVVFAATRAPHKVCWP